MMVAQFLMTSEDQVTWHDAELLWIQGRYFEVHEVLEKLWRNKEGLEREWLAGVILVAAALHKGKTSLSGRRRNLAKALIHLERLPDEYRDFAVAEFRASVAQAIEDPATLPKFPVAGN